MTVINIAVQPAIESDRVLSGLYLVFHHDGGDQSKLVAAMMANNLESVFAATNHGSSELDGWDENPLIQVFDDDPRSTSVGDTVLTPDGTMFRVEPMGWRVVHSGGMASMESLAVLTK